MSKFRVIMSKVEKLSGKYHWFYVQHKHVQVPIIIIIIIYYYYLLFIIYYY